MKFLYHKYAVCEKSFCDCCICKGLSVCETCGAAEGELLASCPGFKLNEDALLACYQGNIIDFIYIKSKILNGFDIKSKKWK